ATTRVVRRALDASGLAAEKVAGIGLSGLMHAPVLLDAAGQPVAPAQLWMDQRCATQVDHLRRDYDERGSGPEPGFTTALSAAKLRWLADVQPEVLARARLLLLPKDFVRYRLTGVAGTDPSDAGGTALFDREAGDWNWEAVRLVRAPRVPMPAI